VWVVPETPLSFSPVSDVCEAFQLISQFENIAKAPLTIFGAVPTLGCKVESIFSKPDPNATPAPTPTPDPSNPIPECNLPFPVPSFAINYDALCCPDQAPDCVKNQVQLSLSGWEKRLFGVNCTIPLWGIPYIAAINLEVGAGLDLKLGDFSMSTACSGDDICLQGSIAVPVKAGVSAGAYVAKLSIYIVITAEGVMNVCYSTGENKWCFQTQLCTSGVFEGDLTFFWWTLKLFSVQMFKVCTDPWDIPDGCAD
jgi:hypothetical protein